MKKMFFLMFFMLTLFGCTSEKEMLKEDISPQYYSLSGKLEDGVRRINLIAYKFGFAPDIIVVNSGEMIIIDIKTLDVAHGFLIEELGIDVKIEPGRDSIVKFKAEKPGTYEFRCSVFCGLNHRKMKGWFIVK